MKQQYVIVNGNMLAAEKASVSVTDLALQRGYGVFDFLKVINGKTIFLDDHLDRFYQSAAYMRLPVEADRNQLKEWIKKLLAKNKTDTGGIKILLTGGNAVDGFTPGKPNMIISGHSAPVVSPQRNGYRLVTYEYQRPFAAAKTIDYAQAIWLQPYIRENKADDVLYYSHNIITECPRANFFLINQQDELVTTPELALKGIIRKKILQLAKGKLVVKEDPILLHELQTAKAAFITSTTKNILPVTQINGRHVSKTVDNEIVNWLNLQLKELIEAEINS